jgi:predicted anti-sigma-YlaC factor YlaD
MKCEVIESMLLDYINRELDPVRSDMVWKHLKKCADCEREVREMESTLAVLRSASRDRAGVPDRLSDKHRASMVRALTHPILHWMERYHVVSSLVVAVIVIAAIIGYLRWVETHPEKPPKYEDPVVVNLGLPPAPATNAAATNEARRVDP